MKNIISKTLIIFIIIISSFFVVSFVKAETAEGAFYRRVEKVYNELKENDSTLDTTVIGSTYYVTQKYTKLGYTYYTEDVIRQLFKYENSDPNIADDEAITYSEEAYRKNIREYWFNKEEFKSFSDDKKDKMVDEIYKHIEMYKYLMGYKEDTTTNGTCSYNVGNKTVSNLKVRLMYCDGSGPIESEELIDFEEYIIGVVSQENGNGPYEALKAQAVAARSYAIMRPNAMNNALGTSLKEENGSWILSLRSCTNDQVFCNPSKGCWSNVTGGQTSDNNRGNWKNCTVYSGYDKSKNWTRGPLSEDSNVRKAVEETRGQVAVDSNGKVVYMSYTNTNQQRWNKMAKEGKDYFEILKKDYSKVSTITSNCSAQAGNAEAEGWKQYEGSWSGKYIGTKTLKQVGCMITSTAIQIARSGTTLNVSNFDPGVFLDTIKANNGVSGNSFNVNDSSWKSIAPNFKVGGVIEFSGSKQDKINKMKQYTTGNNYLIVRLYHPGQHWVAITGIEGDKVMMADPGSKATEFTSKYDISTVTKGYYFVKKD